LGFVIKLVPKVPKGVNKEMRKITSYLVAANRSRDARSGPWRCLPVKFRGKPATHGRKRGRELFKAEVSRRGNVAAWTGDVRAEKFAIKGG